MSGPRPRPAALVNVALLLLAFVAEFLFFDTHASRAQAKIYPRWSDQIQYLGEAYTGYEYARAQGLPAGLWQTLVNPSAQGTLHDFAALVVFEFAGPSRSAALALNLLALIAWQAALFFAVSRGSGSRALAWAAAALPLCLRWPWENLAGSATDFRLDHLAMCALGVTSAAALLTDGFRSRRWSLAFGAAAGITLLTRFLTGTYFVLIFAALLAWVLAGDGKKIRAANLALAALVAFALAAPVFWLNREWVWNYYYIGHYVGPESAIRNQHFGVGQSVAFVWGKFARWQAGSFFWSVAALGAVVLATGVRKLSAPAARDWWVPGAVFLLAPALILTLHQQKSDVVLGALAPGALVLVLAAWLELHRRATAAWPAIVLAAGVVAAAGAFFVSQQHAPVGDEAFRAGNRKVFALADYLFEKSRAAGLAHPAVAVDYVTDSLDAQVMRVVCYERKQTWVMFEMTLPTGIAEPGEQVVMDRLGLSDFVFLSEEGPDGPYPFDHQLTALRPATRAWCEAHLRPVEHFTLFGRRMVLYQRREIPFP